jgi:hypothetical protein
MARDRLPSFERDKPLLFEETAEQDAARQPPENDPRQREGRAGTVSSPHNKGKKTQLLANEDRQRLMPEVDDVQRNEKLLDFTIQGQEEEQDEAFTFISNRAGRQDLPWKCRETDCGSPWPTEEGLNQHHAAKHETTARLPLEYPVRPCPYRTKRPSNLDLHMKRVHVIHQGAELDAPWMVGKDEEASRGRGFWSGFANPHPENVPEPAGSAPIRDTHAASAAAKRF